MHPKSGLHFDQLDDLNPTTTALNQLVVDFLLPEHEAESGT
jgi:hypothetical protein